MGSLVREIDKNGLHFFSQFFFYNVSAFTFGDLPKEVGERLPSLPGCPDHLGFDPPGDMDDISNAELESDVDL